MKSGVWAANLSESRPTFIGFAAWRSRTLAVLTCVRAALGVGVAVRAGILAEARAGSTGAADSRATLKLRRCRTWLSFGQAAFIPIEIRQVMAATQVATTRRLARRTELAQVLADCRWRCRWWHRGPHRRFLFLLLLFPPRRSVTACEAQERGGKASRCQTEATARPRIEPRAFHLIPPKNPGKSGRKRESIPAALYNTRSLATWHP
jgi:hypothetical protein